MMNSLELAISAFTALATGTALFTAVKTLFDARNKSVKNFVKERNLRRETQSRKNK